MKIFVIQAALNQSADPYAIWAENHDDSDVSVITQRQVHSLREAGVTVKLGLLYSRTSVACMFRDFRRLKQEMQAFAPDVVHAHYGSMVGLIGWLLARGKVPFMVTYCGDDLEGTPLPGFKWAVRSRLSRWISVLLAMPSNPIIVNSRSLQMGLPERVHHKCEVLPNGVDMNFFSPSEQSHTQRDALDEALIFFNASSGLNQRVKNPELANLVIEQLERQGRRVRLVKAGKLPAEEFRDALQGARCLLVTSLHEGSPNVVKEALACNIPVVSTDCGDVSERLSSTNLGGVYAATPDALASGVAAVLDSSVSFNGRDVLLQQGLDDSSIASRLIALYASSQQR